MSLEDFSKLAIEIKNEDYFEYRNEQILDDQKMKGNEIYELEDKEEWPA